MDFEEYGISPIIGVLILVAITVAMSLIIITTTFGFGEQLEENANSFAGGKTATRLEDGMITPVKMGAARKIMVLDENGKVRGNITSISERVRVYGGESVVAVSPNGEKKVIQTITEDDVRNSGADIYKPAPSTLDSSNFTLVSEEEYYNESKDRILGSEENYRVKFKQEYDPDDFKYNWYRANDAWYQNNWGYNLNENGHKATYTYQGASSDGGSAAVKITNKESGDSIAISSNSYDVKQPIQSVTIVNEQDYYSDSSTRIRNTNETFNVTNIKLHPQTSEVVGDKTPENLSDYIYNSWYRANDAWYQDNWGYNVDENGQKATYYYQGTSSDGGSAAVSISVPGLENVNQGFSTSSFNVKNPIKSVNIELEEDHYSSNDNRIVRTNETFNVTKVSLRSEVSKIPKVTVPEDPSGYVYNSWYRANDAWYQNNWGANINEKGDKAEYEYTSTSSDGGSAAVSISVPGLETVNQGFSTSSFNVKNPIQSVTIESDESYYSDTTDKILDTDETFNVTSISVHPKAYDVPEIDVPENLSGYVYNSWYRANDAWYQNNWGANINENGQKAVYHYTGSSNDGGSAAVSISVPGLEEVTQGFSTSSFNVKKPIQKISLNSQDYSSSDTRNTSRNETWEVTNIDLHPKVSDIPKATVPDSLSEYQWNGWYRANDPWYQNNWGYNLDENGQRATYDYTSSSSDAASAAVSVSVPGLDPVQSTSSYQYNVDSG